MTLALALAIIVHPVRAEPVEALPFSPSPYFPLGATGAGAAATAVSSARVAIGAWARWGAFADAAPRRCYAIAQPLRADGTPDRRGGFASVAAARGGVRTLHLRLSRPRSPAALLTLDIDDRRFALVGDAVSARAPDAATDRAIVAAMRGARIMTISTLDRAGRTMTDSYALAGAATAIDAAALACARG